MTENEMGNRGPQNTYIRWTRCIFCCCRYFAMIVRLAPHASTPMCVAVFFFFFSIS